MRSGRRQDRQETKVPVLHEATRYKQGQVDSSSGKWHNDYKPALVTPLILEPTKVNSGRSSAVCHAADATVRDE